VSNPSATSFSSRVSAPCPLFQALQFIHISLSLCRSVYLSFSLPHALSHTPLSLQTTHSSFSHSLSLALSVEEIRFVYRSFGAAGDMVMFLKDGAKVELRHVPKFNEIYSFVLSKCDAECQAKSMKLSAKAQEEAEAAKTA
jgi:hypothetical protein